MTNLFLFQVASDPTKNPKAFGPGVRCLLVCANEPRACALLAPKGEAAIGSKSLTCILCRYGLSFRRTVVLRLTLAHELGAVKSAVPRWPSHAIHLCLSMTARGKGEQIQ
jgi:hypothetical protein